MLVLDIIEYGVFLYLGLSTISMITLSVCIAHRKALDIKERKIPDEETYSPLLTLFLENLKTNLSRFEISLIHNQLVIIDTQDKSLSVVSLFTSEEKEILRRIYFEQSRQALRNKRLKSREGFLIP